MKLSELFEAADPKKPFQVPYFSWYIGRRNPDVIKQVFDPFIKKAGQEMKALKGTFNSADGTHDFKTQEQADAAKEKMKELKSEWEEIQKAFPEGRMSDGVGDFFKHQKKVDKSFGRKNESMNEGMYVVKNKDGVEKRFKDHNSPEAKAWKETAKAVKPARYSDMWWSEQEANSDDDEFVTPWTKIDSYRDNDAIQRIVKDEAGTHVNDWHLSGRGGETAIDGTSCATADVRAMISYGKDDDMGVDHDVEEGLYLRIARDPKSPKKLKFVRYLG